MLVEMQSIEFDLGPYPGVPQARHAIEIVSFETRKTFLAPQGDDKSASEDIAEFAKLASRTGNPKLVEAHLPDSKAVALASARLQPLVDKFRSLPVSRPWPYLKALLAVRNALCEHGYPDHATRVALFRNFQRTEGAAPSQGSRHLEHILNTLLVTGPDDRQIAGLLVAMTEAGVADHACWVLMVDCWRHAPGDLERLPAVAAVARDAMVRLHGEEAFVPQLMHALAEHLSGGSCLTEIAPVVRAMNVRGVVPAERNAYFEGVSRDSNGVLQIHGTSLTKCGPEMVPILAALVDRCYDVELATRGKVAQEVHEWAVISGSVLGYDIAQEVQSRLKNREALTDLQIESTRTDLASVFSRFIRTRE